MSQEDEKDIEPVIDKKNKEPEQFGTRKAFKNLPRDLSPDDLNNSGTQKMLLAELERLEIANLKLETKYEEIGNKLEGYKDMYHKCDKDKAVLEKDINHETRNEVLYAFCLTLGSALFGASFSIREATFWWITTLLGLFIMLGGLVYKFKLIK